MAIEVASVVAHWWLHLELQLKMVDTIVKQL